MEEELNKKRGRGRPATGRKKQRYISVAERGLPDRRGGNHGRNGGRKLPDRGSLKVQAVLSIQREMLSALEESAKKLGITRHEFVERAVLDCLANPESIQGINIAPAPVIPPRKVKFVFRNFQIPRKTLANLKKTSKELGIKIRVLVERAVLDYLASQESAPGMNADSVPFGVSWKTKFRFRISSELLPAIQESAKKLGMTQPEFVSGAVSRYLSQLGSSRPESAPGIDADSAQNTDDAPV